MPLSTARRGALAVLLAALILFVLGSIELARAATHAVTISEFAFSPATLTVTAGDTVTWTNEDPVVHTSTSATGAWDSGDLAQGESFSVTLTTPGTFDYVCTPHPSMTGRITVQAAPATPGGSIPDVAMPVRSSVWPVLLGALLLLGAFELAFASRRRRG